MYGVITDVVCDSALSHSEEQEYRRAARIAQKVHLVEQQSDTAFSAVESGNEM